MGPKNNLASEIIIRIKEGKPFFEIRKELGCSKSNVTYHAKKLGIKSSFRSNFYWTEIKQYQLEGNSAKECRTHFNIPAGVWRNSVKRGDVNYDEADVRPKPSGNYYVCVRCSKEYIYKRNARNSTKFCSSCMANKHRTGIKLKIIEALGGECVICGYNKCPPALHLHHKDPKAKKFTISSNKVYSFHTKMEEARKCVILCGNCHAEVHAGITTLPESDSKILF